MEENNGTRPWLLQKAVLPQNTDHAGVMWHGSYFYWLEEARIHALHTLGLKYSELSAQGYELPVVDVQIRYLKPLLHGDIVFLESRFSSSRGARLTCETHFYKDSRDLASIAKVDLVLIQRKNSVNKLMRKGPAKISSALIKLQKGPSF